MICLWQMSAFMYMCISPCISPDGCLYMHHLSVDDGGVLAAITGCRLWVVGLNSQWLYGNELQGAEGGVIWICRTEKEFTHEHTTNTSNHYIVSQRGTNSHTSFLSGRQCRIMLNISRLCQQMKCWMETIDHNYSSGFKGCVDLW